MSISRIIQKNIAQTIGFPFRTCFQPDQAGTICFVIDDNKNAIKVKEARKIE